MIGFAAPWVLAALFALPALWWLLRLLPPSPRLVRFPPIAWLYGLEGRRDAHRRTPIWLLILRVALVAALIAAAAGPVANPGAEAPRTGPLLLVLDDGWAAARDWPARRDAAAALLAEADRALRPVWLLTTTPASDGTPPVVQGPLAADIARTMVMAQEPKPWASDAAAGLKAVNSLDHDQVTQVVWISDGLDSGQGTDLARALQSLGGGVTVLRGQTARALSPAEAGATPHLLIRRLEDGADSTAVRVLDGQGNVIWHQTVTLPAGSRETDIALTLPPEARNRAARLTLEGESSAASTLLLDEGWKRRVVGVAAGMPGNAPLLSPLHYLDRALSPHAEVLRGDIADMLAQRPDALILADRLPGDQSDALTGWVQGGGVLIRFAGPATAQALAASPGGDGLLPVRLRPGGRSLGGSLSWTEPQALAGYAPDSVLGALPVDPEIRISSQVLADPDPTLDDHTWARLADGTPLITAARKGQGWLVLVHTSAEAGWSTLPLSGSFPDLLRRLIALGHGAATATGGILAPGQVLDGQGHLVPAPATVQPLPAAFSALSPGPDHPPGLYGPEGARMAFNLGPSLPGMVAARFPAGISVKSLDQDQRGIDLTGALLAAALILLLLDQGAALWRRGRTSALGAVLLVMALPWQPPPAQAQVPAQDFDLKAGLSTRLAFVQTGDGFVDGKARAGLNALSKRVEDRSTARLDTPMAVVLDRDPVLFFPILYWPLTSAQAPPSAAAIAKLNAYLRAGGMIVLDTGAEAGATGPADPALLRRLTEGLALPALVQTNDAHVLTRSFYLLKDMPGRWTGPVWVAEAGGEGPDGVSPVVLGANDWAGAWATDAQGRPSFPCAPGGERQRELAWRFGINLVMYALTGNYKADQVHTPAILERMGR